MRKLNFSIVGLAAVLVGTPTAEATNCRVQQVVVQKQVAIDYPVVQQVVIPVYGIIPYPAAYPVAAYPAPAAVPAATATHDDVLRELLLEIRSMRQEFRAVAKGEALPPPVAAKQQLDPGTVIKAFRTECAQCHAAAAAPTMGGDFILFAGDGSFNQLTDEQGKRMMRRLANKTMPPPETHKMDEATRQMLIASLKKN